MNDQNLEDDVRNALLHLAEADPVENSWASINYRLEVEPPERSSPRSSFGNGRWLAAAAAALALTGWATLGRSDREVLTVDAVEDSDLVVDGENPQFVGFETCLRHLADSAEALPGLVQAELEQVLADPAVERRRFDHRAGMTRVAFITEGTVATCDVHPDANETANVIGMSIGRNFGEPAHSRSINIADEGWTSITDDGQTGPGTADVVGRVGDDVDAVLLELADGSTTRAVIDRGWFSISANIPPGVALFEQQLLLEFADDEAEAAPEAGAPPSETRWFLAPAEAELRSIDGRGGQWSAAQGEAPHRSLVVTTDLDDQVASGAAWIYYLDDVGIEMTEGPEEFTEAFRDVEIDGRIVRVGSDPDRGTVKAFVAWDPGVVVLGGHGITEADAIASVLSAQVAGKEIELDDTLSDTLRIVEHPAPSATDHTTYIGWDTSAGEASLSMTPGTLARATLRIGSAAADEPTEVRGAPALFFPDIANQSPATLAWVEDGYEIALSIGSDGEGRGLDELLALAETLDRVTQPELVEQFGDEFMARQSTAVAGWLEDRPLPPGWDSDNLIHGVPGGEFETAAHIRRFLSCTWTAEWIDAFERGDDERRTTAYTALSRQGEWAVSSDEIVAYQAIVGEDDTFASRQEVGFAAHLTNLNAVTNGTADTSSVDDCGFQIPEGDG